MSANPELIGYQSAIRVRLRERATAHRSTPERQAAQEHLLAFCQWTFPAYQTAPHLELIASELEGIESGANDRLIIEAPPRHSKTETVSIRFPAWVLCRRPERRIIAASYGERLAAEAGRKVRNIVDTQTLWPEVRLSEDSKARDLWHTQTGGQFLAVGIGSGVVGFGGDVICVTGETEIETRHGPRAIADCLSSVEVLSWNHTEGKAEYRRATPHGVREAEVYRVTTESGRTVRATAEHPFWVEGRGYIPAARLQVGDVLLALDVSAMRGGIRAADRASARETKQGRLLLTRLHGSGAAHGAAPVRHLREADSERLEAILQHGVRCDCSQKGAPGVSTVRCGGGARPDVLRAGVREQGAQRTDSRNTEWPLQAWPCELAVQHGLPIVHAADGDRARPGMSRVWVSQQAYGAPQERAEAGRQIVESPTPVHVLPCKVTRLSREHAPQAVYNLAVEGNENFFANGILTHNCIDDPHKKREEAESAVQREKIWDWYGSEILTRQERDTAIVIVMHRWHEDDLVGRLLAAESDRWRVLRLPALAEDGDPLGRAPGEALWPWRFTREELEAIRDSPGMGERNWNSLYQQRPAPEEGAVFKWFPTYRPDALPVLRDVDIPIDTALGGDDETVAVAWGYDGSRVYWLDALSFRGEAPEAERRLQYFYNKLRQQHPQARVTPRHRDNVHIDKIMAQHLRAGVPSVTVASTSIDGGKGARETHMGMPVASVRLPAMGGKGASSDEKRLALARMVSVEFEGGRALIPEAGFAGPELEKWMAQHKSFPYGEHDDYVETTIMELWERFRRVPWSPPKASADVYPRW